MTDQQQTFTMGGAEINVAYDGTFGDLGAAGDATLFAMNDDFDFSAQYPAVSAGFTAVNDGGSLANSGTVSPGDIFNNNDSFPPSTSFTNLTTPGSTFLDTPDEDYQTSPLFTDNLDVDTDKQWYPLFPEEPMAPPMSRTASSSSAKVMVHPGGEPQRKRSSTNASPLIISPGTPAIKHSSVAGVNPSRKRDKPLPPIMVDENDTVALKRARNTAAARKSRAKKVEERDVLEAQIAQLQEEVEHWKALALSRAKADGMDE